MANVTEEISRWIAEPAYLPSEAAIDLAKDAFLDGVGVILAGINTPQATLTRSLAAEWGGAPQSTILGLSQRTSAPLAALVNGTAAHALDFDDTNHPLYGHPSSHLVPAVLALAETEQASGSSVLHAYLIGFEVEVRLARAVNMAHYAAGWHATGTLGTLGATAAACFLLKLDARRTRNALGIAASMASGLRSNFGTMTKPLHAGLAARGGVEAAQLAQAGFTAADDALAGRYGFLILYSGGEEPKLAELAPEQFGRPWEITEPYGLAIKQFPSCGATHPAIEAALNVSSQQGFDASGVVAVRVGVSALAPRILIYDRPRTGLEGKFSMEYCVAAALLRREVNLDSFTDEAVRDPAVRYLLEQVRVEVDDRVRDSTEFGAVVTVTMREGRQLTAHVDLAKGKTALPLSRQELATKYRNCALRALDPAGVEASLELLTHLDALCAASELTDSLRGSARRRAAGPVAGDATAASMAPASEGGDAGEDAG